MSQAIAPPIAFPPPTQGDGVLARIHLSKALGPEWVPLAQDVVRMLCVQLAVQLMLVMSGAAPRFFSAELGLTLAYVVLGVMLYWLLARKLVAFD